MNNSSSDRPFFDVRMRGFPTRTTVADAIELVRQRVRSLGAEPVELEAAAGRVLSAAVMAAVSVPHFDRAAFDGYAVRAGDAGPLQVIGEARPGRLFDQVVAAGQAVRIMTGAPMPAGADAVLPAEQADESGGLVTVHQPVSEGKNVGHIGEDVPAGRTLLVAGRVLRPQDLGLVSSIGQGQLDVVRRPRVAVIITGDELLPPGSMPTGYRIADSNSVVLRALVRRDGGELLPTRHLADRPDVIREAIRDDGWDVLLISGGTSVGTEDHAPHLVAELGELPVHGVALRPAGPTGIGFVAGRPVFLLPGNPVACLCAYDLFAGRAVRRLGGRDDALPYRTVERVVAGSIPGAAGRLDYVRVTDGPRGVRPVPATGASMLSSTVAADGFVLVPPERDGYTPGQMVTLHCYDP